jgi:hypothetical protein
MFGSTAANVEFAYVSPVEENTELDNATRASKIEAARVLYVDLHASRESIVESLELPATLVFEEPPAPPEPAALPAGNGKPPANILDLPSWFASEAPQPPVPIGPALRWPSNDAERAAQINLDSLQADWERELSALLLRWQDVSATQRAQLRRQIEDAVERGDVGALASLTAEHEDGAAVLAAALVAMAAIGAAAAAAEAAAQGVAVEPAQVDENELGETAAAMALLLALGLAGAAGAEAMRQYAPGADAHTIAVDVDQHLAGLSSAHLESRLGGTLTKAQNLGRIAQMRVGPSARYYATEVLDKNTCQPCREIDGKELPTLDAAMLAYGGSGYLRCAGTWRCRGTMVAVYE